MWVVNLSNVQHVFVFFLFGFFFLFGIRYWWFFVLAILAVEIDQALTYAHPWYLWFAQIDTLLDIIGGLVGLILAKYIYTSIKIPL